VGQAKREFFDQPHRNYSLPDEELFVCPVCTSDEYLRSILTAKLERAECSYCGANPAAPFAVLLDALDSAVMHSYADPAEELPYCGAEGGYQGATYDGSELVESYLDDWTDCDELREEAARSFSGTEWANRDYASLTEYEVLESGWQRFSDQVKHRTRFLFLQELEPDVGDDYNAIPPGRMLDALGRLFQEYRLFRVFPLGTEFVRTRVIQPGERPSTAAELGTAPREVATQSNRMSPAGIPMFYAAIDENTAVLETYEPNRSASSELAIARFRSARALNVLDLTCLPDIPSQFDEENRNKRFAIMFLRAFEHDLTQPVARDDRVHVEYVPTQVVTEYVRHRLRDAVGGRIDGIVYRSSKAPSSNALVIFADPEHCGPRSKETSWEPEPYLELTTVRYALPDEFSHARPS
jgi:hypothetical protein